MKWPTLRWIGRRLKDLFYGPGNKHLDLARICSFVAILSVPVAAVWNAYLGKDINLQQLGVGVAGVVTACAVLIKAKDSENRKARDAAQE